MNTETSGIPKITEAQLAHIQEIRDQPKKVESARLIRCPACGEASLVQSSELTWEEPTDYGLIIIAGLGGEFCTRCGERWFNARSFSLIEEKRSKRFLSDYEVSISRVGGKSLGVYLPKDVQRVLALSPGMKARLIPLSKSSFLVRVRSNENDINDREFEESMGFE